jgi:hypothetical protein
MFKENSYKPKLLLNTKALDDVQLKDKTCAEISEYSITSRTFKSRSFNSNFTLDTLLEATKIVKKKYNDQLLKLQTLFYHFKFFF